MLASADILEDLLSLGVLDGTVAVGTMNRGGLAGAVFELDDRLTGHRAEDIARSCADAGKLLLQIGYVDPGSLNTLASVARCIDEMAARRLHVFVEPFISRRVRSVLRKDLSARAVIRPMAIASGLGGTSAYTWLKIPVTEDVDDRGGAEGVDTADVLLGGEVDDDQELAHERWGKVLEVPTVQGLVLRPVAPVPGQGDGRGGGGRRGEAAAGTGNLL